MRRQPILIAVAGVYLFAIVCGAFVLPEPMPTWAAAIVWFGAGALVAATVPSSRWWVVLGFLWLGAAWVEAGQAVWSERPGSLVDVAVGCVASGLGVGLVVAIRALRDRQRTREAVVIAGTPAAPRPR